MIHLGFRKDSVVAEVLSSNELLLVILSADGVVGERPTNANQELNQDHIDSQIGPIVVNTNRKSLSAKLRNMSNKRRVFVSIYHRGLLSLGENRQQLGYAAYHWGILISPKAYKEQNCYTFDVSDAARPDPETRVDHNPNHEWVFRSNPTVSGSVVCLIMIGKLPNGVEISEIRTCLQSIPVPQKNATPEQNCVTWAMAAVQALQDNGYAEKFEINQFMDAGIEFADETLADKSGTPATVAKMNYTTRKIRTCLLGARARIVTAGTISAVPAQLLALPADAAVVLALLGEHALGWHSG
ncbi:hypothetical protein V494_04541 [Pseudogymnoascus sp. VKM F-4513 (FW-928)]|nr:hypothetical protein V494_04541 [Pseudogymnoascus sp. VKM F-4513 (FW-928)]